MLRAFYLLTYELRTTTFNPPFAMGHNKVNHLIPVSFSRGSSSDRVDNSDLNY